MGFFSKIFKTESNAGVVQKIQPIVDQINALEPEMRELPENGFAKETEKLKLEAREKSLDEILPRAFALAREANRRLLNVRHYDVQLVGGVVLHRGEIAEMKTGEGKTHVAALPFYLNALVGQCHAITVNDYLAKRDAGWNGCANHLLGLKTACLVNQASFIYDPEYEDNSQTDERLKNLKPCGRQEAYEADIVYGTNSEFGFDYLRDNMASSVAQVAQKDLYFAIVDEVDSVLIDEARTPLIISAPAEESAKLYQKFASLVPRLKENQDYNVDEKLKTATLTEDGINKIEEMLNMGNIYTEGGVMMVHHLEQALRAHAVYKKDKDYVVQEGQVVIIDEFTGRMMHGRRYSEGLHQAIEAKEGVEVQKESRTLATITIQNYFRMYDKLAGMTGTAATEAEEFKKIYDLDVTIIPTNKPVQRKDLPDRIYSTEKGKFTAVVRDIRELQKNGQPVLVGTISVEKNELLSALLKQAGIEHNVLNAKAHAQEAKIIAQAGKRGSVTIATNMAGRGVDIVLGGSPFDAEEYEKVKELGGLFVLGTERHESRRIDNQLRGRSGRQGDPGVTQFYVSMEDDLMRIFGSDRVKKMMQSLGVPEDQPIETKIISNSIEKAQKRVEGHNFDIRKHLVEYDDVINKQREIIYKRRRELLYATEKDENISREKIMEMIADELEQVVSFHTAGENQSEWNLREIAETVKSIFPVSDEDLVKIQSLEKIAGDTRAEDAAARTLIIDYLVKLAEARYQDLENKVKEQGGDESFMRRIEREIIIRSIDNLWVDHLDAVAALRGSVGLRGYAQRDPLIEYKRETYNMFLQLQNLIQRQVVYSIYKVGFGAEMRESIMSSGQEKFSSNVGQFGGTDNLSSTKDNAQSMRIARKITGAREASQTATKNEQGKKISRNDPCPCGSGKKYKKCCG